MALRTIRTMGDEILKEMQGNQGNNAKDSGID